MYTVTALWRRELIKFLRDKSRVGGAVLQPLVVWLLLGFGFRDTFQLPSSTGTDIPYLEFLFPGMLALVALFTSIFSTISIVEERKSGFLQAALAAPVSRSVLVLGATLGGTTLAVGQSGLFLILLPFLGPPPTVAGLALMLFVLALIGLAFTALGVTVAWKIRTTRGFHAVMNLFLIPLWVLSGAFFPPTGAPPLLQWIVRLNPFSYGVDALRTAMYWPGPAPEVATSLAVSLPVTIVFTGLMFALAVRSVATPIAPE
ncbi:MAG: ABC transporter permease [Rhodothermales bacterium]